MKDEYFGYNTSDEVLDFYDRDEFDVADIPMDEMLAKRILYASNGNIRSLDLTIDSRNED